MNRLSEWPWHSPAQVIGIEGDEAFSLRIQDLGLQIGAIVEVIGSVPFGGPLLVRAKGGTLAMRKGEAACVLVQAQTV